MLIRKYQNRKLAKKAVLARMANREVQEPRTIDMVDWQRTTLIGLGILGILYMKNKRKRRKYEKKVLGIPVRGSMPGLDYRRVRKIRGNEDVSWK